MRILVVEDEVDLCDSIAEGLQIDGYAVDTCYDGNDAYELIMVESYDLVILDLNLPRMDGIDILTEVRKQNKNVKILILSARGSVFDKVLGLDTGANDYLAKPFDFEELEARIRSLLRRSFTQEHTLLTFESISLDTVKRTVFVNDAEVSLTKKELALLEYFLFNPNKVINQEEIMEHVWNMDADSFSNAVRVHIASLRKKLKAVLSYDPIATKIGEGYYLRGDEKKVLKKMSIRLRLTIMSVLLLTVCCIGLTVILNLSANRMANIIEATTLTPATEVAPNMEPIEPQTTAGIAPLTPSVSTQAARTQFLHQSILNVILIVAIGGGVTYYLSGEALKPLQELSSQMKNRTVHNLSEDLPIPESRDEIADLTRSFNEMSDKLNEVFAMQKRFSQSAAHELRTPLTVLKTKMDVFKKKTEHTPEEYDRLLSVITTHTNRMSVLVKDLLDLSNMDALSCNEHIQLKVMLYDIAEELSCLTAEKNITVTICGEERTVCGNQSLLHRAFYNLIENAIKYNSKNGQIQISVAAVSNHSTVTISDTGIGIPPEMRELVFEPFFRVDKSRSRQMGGAGLGLSTVKAIIEKHHGQIAISDNPTGGTVFEVTL